MILFIGSFQFVPLLAVIALSVVLSLGGAFWTLLVQAIGSEVGAQVALGSLTLIVLGGMEVFLRRREERPARGVLDLEALVVRSGIPVSAVGGKALMLARLRRSGIPVPDAIVMTSELCAALIEARPDGASGVWAAIPYWGKKCFHNFLHGSRGSKLIIRSSFVENSSKLRHPGIYPSVRNINPNDPGGVLDAIFKVLQGLEGESAKLYRRRNKIPGVAARAIIIQRQIDADTLGISESRGEQGRADTVTIDYTLKRSRTRSVRYDIVNRQAHPLGSVDSLPGQTHAFMWRLAMLSVALEVEMEAPVQIEFAVYEGQLFVLQVRLIPPTARTTWLSSAPIDIGARRNPRLLQDLRGGIPLIRSAIGNAMRDVGVVDGPTDAELKLIEDTPYIDAQVLRRVLARNTIDILLNLRQRQMLRLIRPIRRLPPVPTDSADVGDSWKRLRDWYAHASGEQLRLLTRRWLLEDAVQMVGAESGAAAVEQRVHPVLRWLLRVSLARCAKEVHRTHSLFETAEEQVHKVAPMILARGAEAWDAMFIGDRYLHTSLEELDNWLEGKEDRNALEAKWKLWRDDFLKREGQEIEERIHEPRLKSPKEPKPNKSLIFGVAVVPGRTKGSAQRVGAPSAPRAEDTIVILPDGRADFAPFVFFANGIILQGGGILSPVAALAQELKVPTVLCTEILPTDLTSGRTIQLDGALGVVAL